MGGVLAPPFAALLLVAHVRVWDAVGVTLPEWVNIPPLGRGRAPLRIPSVGDREHDLAELLAPLEPSGDYEADLPRLQTLYAGVRGLRD